MDEWDKRTKALSDSFEKKAKIMRHSENNSTGEFYRNGFLIFEKALSDVDVVSIGKKLQDMPIQKVGTRNLLSFGWCRKLAGALMGDSKIKSLLPEFPVVIQCTYFEKTPKKNWLVALHRDKTIPVKNRIQSKNWSTWSIKEGVHFAQPPESVLKNLVSVRVHLEDNDSSNSPLNVVPGSHEHPEIKEPRVACLVPQGGALVMRPLLLHASSKLVAGNRRVLHFLFGPQDLPDGASWPVAI